MGESPLKMVFPLLFDLAYVKDVSNSMERGKERRLLV